MSYTIAQLMLFKVSYTNDERQSLWQSLPLSQQWRGQLTRHKIATVHVYLTRTGPSSTTSKCTTRSTETQYIRGHRLYVTHSPLIQKHSQKTRPTRLNSPARMIKKQQTLKITRALPPRSLTYFIKHSGTNPMATILPRHPY